MTRLALIPPVPHLDLGITDMQFMLAHLCDDPKYLKFYRERNLKGDFLLLDNSAYEFDDSQRTMAQLLALGYYIQVNEIVAPDAIMHERLTYAHSLESVAFLSTTAGMHAWKRAGSPRIMVVPQVDPKTQSIDAYDRHARVLLQAWHWSVPYLSEYITLGVSKNMDKLTGGWLLIFREVVQELIKEYPIQVHTLGLPHRLTQVRRVLKENPFIRSIDTAQPYVSALANRDMTIPDDGYPARPDGYEYAHLDNNQRERAAKNAEWLKEYLFSGSDNVPRVVAEREQAQFESRPS
jgi:hypothetical protein